MRRFGWFPVSLAALAALVLGACAGTPPQLENVEIEASSQGETRLEFVGLVDSMGSNAWSVGGLAVGMTASTEVVGSPLVGDLVRVHALVQDPATLVALQIERIDGAQGATFTPSPTAAPGEEFEFSGPVVSITAESWTVGDLTVAITSETEFNGAISAGQVVKVHALVQPDLSLTAREIEPVVDGTPAADEDHDDGDLEIEGQVQAIEGENWTVAGMAILVPAGTPIEGVVQVGDFVEVHAAWSSGGVLTALRVQLEDEPESMEDSEDDTDGEDDESEEEHDEEEHDDGDDSGSGDG